MSNEDKEKYIGMKIKWYNFKITAEIINADVTGFIIKVLDNGGDGKYYHQDDIVHIPADAVFKFV